MSIFRVRESEYNGLTTSKPSTSDVIKLIKDQIGHANLLPSELRLVSMAHTFKAPNLIGFKIDKNEHTLVDSVDGLLWPLGHTTRPGDIIYLSIDQLPRNLGQLFTLTMAGGVIQNYQQEDTGKLFDNFSTAVFSEKKVGSSTQINDEFVAAVINGKYQLVRKLPDDSSEPISPPQIRAPALSMRELTNALPASDSSSVPVTHSSAPVDQAPGTQRVSLATTVPVRKSQYERKYEDGHFANVHKLDFDEIETDAHTRVTILAESLSFDTKPTVFITPNGSRYVPIAEGSTTIYCKIPATMRFKLDGSTYVLE